MPSYWFKMWDIGLPRRWLQTLLWWRTVWYKYTAASEEHAAPSYCSTRQHGVKSNIQTLRLRSYGDAVYLGTDVSATNAALILTTYKRSIPKMDVATSSDRAIHTHLPNCVTSQHSKTIPQTGGQLRPPHKTFIVYFVTGPPKYLTIGRSARQEHWHVVQSCFISHFWQ